VVDAGRPLYRFNLGESPSPPPRRVQQALRSAAYRKEYADVAGLLAMRESIF